MTHDLSKVTQLHALDPTKRVFVMARARGLKVAEAAKEAGVTRQTAAAWDQNPLNEAIWAVQLVLFETPADAVRHLVGPAVARLEKEIRAGGMVGYLAAKEVLDRYYGKAPMGVHISGGLGLAVKGYTSAASPDDWDNDPPPLLE